MHAYMLYYIPFQCKQHWNGFHPRKTRAINIPHMHIRRTITTRVVSLAIVLKYDIY